MPSKAASLLVAADSAKIKNEAVKGPKGTLIRLRSTMATRRSEAKSPQRYCLWNIVAHAGKRRTKVADKTRQLLDTDRKVCNKFSILKVPLHSLSLLFEVRLHKVCHPAISTIADGSIADRSHRPSLSTTNAHEAHIFLRQCAYGPVIHRRRISGMNV